MAQADPVVAVPARFGRSRVGKITNAPRGRFDDVGAALRARPLLEQHELAAAEVLAGAARIVRIWNGK